MADRRVILLLAHAGDEQAVRFAQRYAKRGVHLLTPADLSQPGWISHWSQAHTESRLVIDGRPIAERHLAGVLVRLEAVLPADVMHIAADDRAYVAAEMQAYLVAWLDQLRCPRLNRPTAGCLAGPAWTTHRWRWAASGLGLAVAPMVEEVVLGAAARPAPLCGDARTGRTVTVIGDRVIGARSRRLQQQAQALAQTAGVDCVSFQFSSGRAATQFLGASLWPDLSDERIARAMLEQVRRQARPPLRCAVNA